jgi:4-amino-4-deoxy-L-arabinose transferase-like glycosyltransferase
MANSLLFAFSFFIICASAVLMVSVLRVRSRVGWILSFFLTFTSIIVLTVEIAALFSQLNQPGLFIAIQSLFLCIMAIVWFKKGKPKGWLALHGVFSDLVKNLRESSFILKILALSVALTYFVNAILVIIVPPNTYDALTTHLARVRFWIQFGNLLPWHATYLPQVIYPVNAQAQYLWMILLGGSDRFVGGVQYMAWLAGFIAIIGIARLLGWQKKQAIFAALIWSTFPQVIMQSTSTQNDLTAAAYFCCGLYFLFHGLKSLDIKSLIFSGIGIALALGTKQTIAFLLPGLAVAILVFLLLGKVSQRKHILFWAGGLTAAILCIGSYIYIQNFIIYRDFFGPPNTTSYMYSQSAKRGGLQGIFINSIRFAYQAIDPSGLPGGAPGYLQKFKSKISEFAGLKNLLESKVGTSRDFETRNLPALHEDSTWFGLAGFFLLVPCFFYETWRGIRRRNPYILTITFLVTSFCVFLLLFRPGWDPFQGRYFTVPVSISAALMAGFYHEKNPRKILIWIIGVFSIITMISCLLFNESKALGGESAIWGKDRYRLQSVTNPKDAQVFKKIDAYLPKGANLGFSSVPTSTVYLLFGEDLSRKLTLIDKTRYIQDREFIKNLGIDYFFARNDSLVGLVKMDYLKRVVEFRDWSLYQIVFKQ